MKTASLTFWFACMVEGTVSPPLQLAAQLLPSQSTKESLNMKNIELVIIFRNSLCLIINAVTWKWPEVFNGFSVIFDHSRLSHFGHYRGVFLCFLFLSLLLLFKEERYLSAAGQTQPESCGDMEMVMKCPYCLELWSLHNNIVLTGLKSSQSVSCTLLVHLTLEWFHYQKQRPPNAVSWCTHLWFLVTEQTNGQR